MGPDRRASAAGDGSAKPSPFFCFPLRFLGEGKERPSWCPGPGSGGERVGERELAGANILVEVRICYNAPKVKELESEQWSHLNSPLLARSKDDGMIGGVQAVLLMSGVELWQVTIRQTQRMRRLLEIL
jgi:hypothetical protein